MVKKRRNRQKMASNVASDDSIETIQRISDEVLLERGNPAKTPPKMSSEAPKSKSSIKSTPKIRRFKRLNRTFNVTNLNILFDSSYINQTTPERASTTIVATPATADGSTQTFDHDTIVETPKIAHFARFSDTYTVKKTPNIAKNAFYDAHHININPYVKNSEVKLPSASIATLKDFTLEEIHTKQHSTPLYPTSHHIDILNNSAAKSSPKPIIEHKINNILRQSTNIIQSSSKLNNTYSILHRSGQANAARNVETVFSRFKRYSRTSLRWPDKFIHFCSTIGFTVKRTLSGIYSRYSLEKVEESKCRCGEYRREIFELRCKVDELRMEMDGVKLQLELQKQTDVGKMLDKDVVEIVRIGVLKEIETQLREMAEKVNNNQASINLFTNSNYAISTPVSSTCVLIGGGGGGPPPPPPPPPPLPPLFVPTNNDLKITKKDRSECGNGSNKENSRPVIALDDILKVKLKKATERPRLQRRATQPAISTEMIRNVKLKPASRPQTPLLDTEIISTSPCSSLVRLLSESSGNSIPVGKVKRLKRTRGYSFDDLSRKTQTATTRWGDRERTTYN